MAAGGISEVLVDIDQVGAIGSGRTVTLNKTVRNGPPYLMWEIPSASGAV
jgi:hypothetical protein